MKTMEPITTQMDEIVFEHRNKTYGAYILRKMYNKQLMRAIVTASVIMIGGLAYPLISNYNDMKNGKYITTISDPVFFSDVNPPDDKPVVPPPPAVNDVQQRFAFVAPQVVAGAENYDGELPNMDDYNDHPTNVPVDLNPETPVTRQLDIIPEPVEKEEIKTFVEEMPTYQGGESERVKFLSENIKYPQLATETGVQGTVYVRFVVDSKGNITNAQVIRGIGGGCDEEALRVIKMMPQWHSGRQNGRSVPVLFTMPVVFKLQS